MPFYHYTSRLAAQDISSTGIMQAGPSGQLYLTTLVYVTGSSAADALGITKLVEIGLELPDNPPFAGITGPTAASPVVNPAGVVIRRGGGPEFTCPGPIAVREGKWLSLREP
jgi:hypothetical protein